MKLRDRVVQVIQGADPQECVRLAEFLSCKIGFNYADSYLFICDCFKHSDLTPPELNDWEYLLYEGS